jgi:processive 1,2-diacylglycerol beta-glucosyltransferase
VLVLTADIGAGHDLPAELLAGALRERGADAIVVDSLAAMGPIVLSVIRRGSETILQHLRPLFDLQYWLISWLPPTRWLMRRLSVLVGAPGLLRLIERTRPDAIVSTYPGTTEILGELRRDGRLPIPCASAITDLAALRYWANRHIDLHLITHAESAAEVRRIAGRETDVRHVRGFVRPQFEDPPTRRAARAALGLPATGPVVIVSGGGWGIGDLEQAARVVLGLPSATVACLCGTNERLRERLESDLAGEPRARVEGFTDRMHEWLAAADVLVHSTAGLTVLEAIQRGCPAISYGWGHGHIRVNNRAFAAHGLAAVARTPDELAGALRRALRERRPPELSFAALPDAAEVVLERLAAPREQHVTDRS